MKGHFLHTALLDVTESVRSRWFLVYTLIFGALVAGLFVFGLTESRVMGFTGLSRLLVTYIQLCMAVLPVFILITTFRSSALKTWSMIRISSNSLSRESLPITSTSHWKNSR